MKHVFLLLVTLVLASCKTEDKEIVIGHTGQARLNPYLAAERMVSELGGDAQSLPGWVTYNDGSNFVMLPASAIGSEGIASRLSRWCEDGGQLVVNLNGAEGYHNDWSNRVKFSSKWSVLLELPEGLTWWQTELGVTAILNGVSGDVTVPEFREDGGLSKEPQGRESKIVEVRGMKVGVESGWGMHTTKRGARADYTDDEKNGEHAIVHRSIGYGGVTFVNDARPFRNAFIGNHDNAAFLTSLCRGGGDVYGVNAIFVYGSGTPFFTLLWKHGWRIVLACLVALVIWLWRLLPRFGPMQNEQKDTTRDFLHHVKAWGHFLWRQKQPNELLDALRREVMSGYELEQINATEVNRASLVDLFVKRTGLNPEDVLEALTRKDISESTVLVKVIRNLQKMRNAV